MLRLLPLCLLLWIALTPVARGANLTVEKDDEGVAVKIDGKLFTRYVTQSGVKPILWPIIGPSGKEITRQYPMRKALPTEKADHPHQRSLWFTHGDVNGVSFWHEGEGAGTIKHREFTKIEGGERPVIQTTNDWITPQGEKVCEDIRTFTFGADDQKRWIDLEVTVKAPADKEVKFGDTKEGSMGVRVAGSMDVDAKKGGKIVNSRDQTNGEAWGRAAEWVDYHGPVEGDTVGIAILNHPSSFRFPTTWHVRTYGLFAANPFGLHDFPDGKNADGSHTLKPGESFTLKYRILFHRGDEKQAKIAEAYAEYAAAK
jgi:hypothetical protein